MQDASLLFAQRFEPIQVYWKLLRAAAAFSNFGWIQTSFFYHSFLFVTMAGKNSFNDLLSKKNSLEDDDEDDQDDDYDPANDSDGKLDWWMLSWLNERLFVLVESEPDKHADSDDDETNKNSDFIKIDDSKIDQLWESFCTDVNKNPSSSGNSQPTSSSSSLSSSTTSSITKKETDSSATKTQVVKKVYDFCGETVVIEEEEPVVSNSNISITKNGSSSSQKIQPPTMKRGVGQLDSLIAQMKKPKMNTLTKSMHDWQKYKQTENLTEDLKLHRESKDSYLERQAFLSRTDAREFEKEKAIRDYERKMRAMPNPKWT